MRNAAADHCRRKGRRAAVAAVGLALFCAGVPAAAGEPSRDGLVVVARATDKAPHRAKKAKSKRALSQPAAATTETRPKLLSRAEILAADPTALERIGRHIVIGYHDPRSVKALVEKKAIAGIFITDHNVHRRKVDDILGEIEALQKVRAAQGLPPLIVAADQEGGNVSRLSPPLARQPGLRRVIAKVGPQGDMKAAVVGYARVQARELKRVGVNLNFSPVVDLNIDPKRRSDGETQLRYRALSPDPKIVADAAGWYCDTLAEEGIHCTIKHFPGLGRVRLDTHRTAGEIKAPLLELKGADWLPFRALMERPHVVTMLAHVRLAELDKAVPASFSAPVIGGLLRTEWKHEGLLITDDFSMGAVTLSKDGVGGAAVRALNAGADLILVSFSDKHLNAIMSALLDADANGRLDGEARRRSRARLARLPAAQRGHAAPAAAATPAVAAPAP